jgi:RHS repeat-associated protein
VYDGADLVGVLDAGGATLAAHVYSGAIDEPLASRAGGADRYLYANHLGSVVALAQGTTLTHAYRYGPYGETLAGSSADAALVPFGYTGREKDAEGLYYYRARYYSSAMRVFTQSDPIGLAGGINTYAYVNGNPVSYVDPEGLIPWWAVGWGVANGLMSGYQRWLDPCASWGQIGRDFAGGFASGFIAGIVPITSMRAGGAILAGAAAGYGGSQASSLISSGSMASPGAAMQSTLLGGLGGAAGNMSGLGAALANVRLGLPATNALRTGDRLGTGVGVGVSALDTASQFSPAQGRDDCTCRR